MPSFQEANLIFHNVVAFQTVNRVFHANSDGQDLTIFRFLTRHVRETLESQRKQLGEAQEVGTDRLSLSKVADLEAKIADVQAFDERLRHLLKGYNREARIL